MTSPDLALTDGVDRDVRRALVVGSGSGLLGIDRVEVLSNLPGSHGYRQSVPVRRTLLVWMTAGRVPDDLRADQVRITGGVRIDPLINPVRVLWAYRVDRLADGMGPEPTADDRQLVTDAVPDADLTQVLAVRTSSAGDWSTYVLELVGDGTAVPAGFDPPLARAPFAFTVDLPSDIDDHVPDLPPEPAVSPALDYLARDYDALRTRLLDRLATLLPNWTDRGPADPVVTLAELFAALGDRLAVWQDAVAAEAYIGTARRRASVGRHARLLDYRMHEGCSARTWLSFTVPDGLGAVTLDVGSPVADRSPDDPGPFLLPTGAEVVRDGGIVFETCQPVTLRPENNGLWLHSWGVPEQVLPVGCTSAFVRHPADRPPQLQAGDVVILAAVGATDEVADGDPTDRHAVRLVAKPIRHVDGLATGVGVLELRWSQADALPRPLVVAVRDDDGEPRMRAQAIANVVLADHGATVAGEPLLPDRVPFTGSYRPALRQNGLTWAAPPPVGLAGATAALVPDPRAAVPAVTVDDGTRRWQPRVDLLTGGPGAAAFVVESEPDGTSTLRFGDGVAGRRPDGGTSMVADYRVGGTSLGNVAAGVLTTVLLPARGSTQPHTLAQLQVTNLLPAMGGTDPEPLATAQERAPRAFRTQQRAVTVSDYAAVAMAHPGVSRAVARRRWTGSWHAVEVAVDTAADGADDADLRTALLADLIAQRMLGVDVTIGGPTPVPLEIVIRVQLRLGYPRSEARRMLAAAFGTSGSGFFHPDRFTFGQSLQLTDVVLTAMSVTGVDGVDVGDDGAGLRFRRWGRPPAAEVDNQRIDAGAREVLRADSDPNRPENGRVDFLFVGGT